MSARPVSPAEIPKLYSALTENSDPAASQLFKECFELMDHGNVGREKLSDAAGRFWIYYHQWPGPGEYEELTKAALFNSAAICPDLLNTAQENNDEYAKNAREALNSFLAKWPNDPHAAEATNLLNSLNRFHPKP